jgi:4-carboxymuconolactone decarboxylase
MDAPAASYAAHIILADQVGITPDTLKGILVTLAPLVGSARIVSAADNVLQVVRKSF